jgi:Domain of unknown function (DUF4136)
MNGMRMIGWSARFVALAIVLVGCATKGPAIRSDHDRSVDFAALKTFGFPAQTGTDRGGYATLITSHFKEAIKREMTVRGYTYTDTNPDMLVNFYSESKDKTRVYSHPDPYFMGGFRYGRPRYGWYSAWPFYFDDVDVVNYTAGTLKLDVVDPKRQQTIWEAQVEERLSEQAQDSPQPMISRLVTAMFAKFPRGATQPQG